MARRRLNKKVVIVGSIALALILIGAVGIMLRLTQDPEEFIREGDAARAAKDYETAARNYQKAYGLTKKDNAKRIEIAFKLADLHAEYNEWPKAMGTWNAIINLDSKNVKARSAFLNYLYEAADSGNSPTWRDVERNATELIDIEPSTELYFIRGRARYEIGNLGQTTNREEMLAQAREDLRKVLELEPGNVETYQFLARTMITEGGILASRGAFDEEEKSRQRAAEILEQAVAAAPDNANAHTNLLSQKLGMAKDIEQVRALEPEFAALAKRFASSTDVFAALSVFYLRLGRQHIDKALEAIEKASDLDRENVPYAIAAARLHYYKGSYPWKVSEIFKGITIAEQALTLSAAQDVPGPRQTESRAYRFELYGFLANCYIELLMETSATEAQGQKQEWLTKAEQNIDQVQQILDSGEHPYSVMWDGMLAMVRGDKDTAIKKLYFSFDRLKAVKVSGIQPTRRRERQDIQFARLSYALAKVLEDNSEIGVRIEALGRAIEEGILLSRPEVILDYAEILLRTSYLTDALRAVSSFEENFLANDRSRQLRLRSLIATGQYEQAEQELAQMDPDEAETMEQELSLREVQIQRNRLTILRIEEARSVLATEEEKTQASSENYELLKADFEKYINRQAELLDKLLLVKVKQAYLPTVVSVCRKHISRGNIQQARNVIDRFLQSYPDNTSALTFKQQLLEPDFANITPARANEIKEQVLLSIPDPAEQALQLGYLNQQNNDIDKAAEHFEKALEIKPTEMAARALLNLALQKKDFDMTSRLVDIAIRENLDGCGGQFFAAHVALAKEEYKDALIKADDCLKQRPVFAGAYALRSTANSALGNESAAINDAVKSVSFDPLDGGYAKRLAFMLYRRDRRLGANVTPEQLAETKSALVRAKASNPNDLQLLSFYAEYIRDEEPMEALAYRQRLQRYAPSVENALLLGNLATKLAFSETEGERKAALLQIASSAFEEGYKIDPQHKPLLASWADFFRRSEQPQKAEEILAKLNDEAMVWRHYIRTDQIDKAKQVLNGLYEADPKNIDVIKGLLFIAERTNDKEAMPRYMAELLSLEDTLQNRFYEIRVLINSALIEQAENRLSALKEKYPKAGELALLEAHLKTKTGQFDDALDLLNRILETNRADATAWRLRGELNLYKGNYTQAISDLQQSKAIAPLPGIRVKLAMAYVRSRRADDAITELVAALNEDAGHREARILLEQVYLLLGRKDALLKLYEEALEKYPEDVFWHNRAANYLFRTREDMERASQLWYEAWQNSQKTGGNVQLLDAYLMSLQTLKKYDELLKYGSEYVEGEFAPIAYAGMAAMKVATGDSAMAVEYYQKAIEKAGTNEQLILDMLGRMYTNVGRREMVRWCAEKLRAEPDSFVATLAMFNVMSISAEYNKALSYLEKCLKIIEGDPDKSQLWDELTIRKANTLQRGYAKTSDEQYLDAAIRVYESILEKKPNKTDVLNNLAYILAIKNEQPEQAVRYAEKACKLQPGSPDYLDTYAFVLYTQGQYNKAAEIERSAIQLFEQGATARAPAAAYDTLGRINEKLEQYKEALAAYQQALELGKNQLSKKDQERISQAIERLSVLAGSE